MIPNRTQQIYNIIEYIKQSGVSFTCRDAIENIQHILDKVGIITGYSDYEHQIFRQELLRIASEKAVQEISYLIQNHPEPVLEAIALHQQLQVLSIQTKRR